MTQETITFYDINEVGEDSLAEWLGSVLKSGDLNTSAWIKELIEKFDGSEELGPPSIEVRSFHTRSGHPETYTFGPSEYDIVTADAFGKETSRERAE